MAGLETLADWNFWKISDFQYYVDTVFNIFGPERIMFGTDWPMCLTGGSYGQVLKIVEATTGHLPETEKEKIWATNCSNFYKLSV